MEFIAQPLGRMRLGEYLIANLADQEWTRFRAAIAFVKRSGTQYVQGPLLDFSRRGEVKMSVGVDLWGTSREGLLDLLGATQPNSIYVYRNNGPQTFHPKVYIFASPRSASVLVGSGNMTAGGLFTNYEASLLVSLDLQVNEDQVFLRSVEETLDGWSTPARGTCYELTTAFIDQLVAAGLVRSEADLAALQRANRPVPAVAMPVEQVDANDPPPRPDLPIFITVNVPPAPPAPRRQREADDNIEADENAVDLEAEAAELGAIAVLPPPGIIAAQGRGPTAFVMTLQQTDVGVGQTTRGTARRSPEVFIPLAALDEAPSFWTFPDQFTADDEWNDTHANRRNGLGKMDRVDVPMRVGSVQEVRMFFNPRKGDFRLGNEALRSAGQVGDILLIRRVDPVNGFEYDVQVAPQGTPLFRELEPLCQTAAPAPSLKRFGYF